MKLPSFIPSNFKLPKLPKISLIGKAALTFFVAGILCLSLRGAAGNPDTTWFESLSYKNDGPLELSPERGRFVLIYSLVEDRSLFFSVPVAKFATPDLGYWRGKYVSLFAPGVSLLTIPGYIIGKYYGASQVGVFAVIAFFAICNFFLILKISRSLGVGGVASTIAGLMFLFASPAFSYAVTLYQHHISTFLILLSMYLVITQKRLWWTLIVVWFLCASALLIDYPNLFLMFPIGLSALIKLITIQDSKDRITIRIKPTLLLTFVGVVVPLVIFGLFNYYSYGSPFRLSGTVPYIAEIDSDGNPVIPLSNDKEPIVKDLAELSSIKGQSSVAFFNPRNMANGFYIHLFSPDRGVLYYTPIMFVGVIGVVLLYKQKYRYLPLLLSVVLIDLLLYSMWGDPWGGWAFGSRYLIPAYAIMSIFVAVVLDRFKKNIPLLLIIFGISLYSVGVNTIGALTSNRNPPYIQILSLEEQTGRRERYTFTRGMEMLSANRSKSFIFQEEAYKYLSAWQYTALVATLLGIVLTGLFITLFISERHAKSRVK